MDQFIEIESVLKIQFTALKKKKNLLSNIRLIGFILTCIFLYLFITSEHWLWLIATILSFVGFLFYVAKSTNASNQLAHIQNSLEVLKQIKSDDLVDNYQSINHENFDNVYNRDLDILDGKSLFNRINKTQSYIGNVQLKHFLSHLLVDKYKILDRQNALDELADNPSWMLDFLTFSKKVNLQSFQIFGSLNRQFNQFTLRFLPISLGVINAITFLVLLFLGFPKKAVFFWIITAIPLGYIINLIYKNKINQSLSFAFINAEQLDGLIDLLALVETKDFEEINNQTCQNGLLNDGINASTQLTKIKSTMDGFSVLGIPIFGFLLNQFTLWKLYHTIQLECRVGNSIQNNENWMIQLSVLEAYISFAIFNLKFDQFTRPQISDQPNVLKLKEAFHPLLNAEIAVKNNFESNRSNNIAIITGANMAGKSTFLRTIGTNLVLAMNGANVSADEMEFFPMDIFTSIRTVDNLSSGDSYFKNEINKLKILIDRLEDNQPQYIILDEILKGTNSQDKLIGSQQFLEKLIRSKTDLIGFIATHDLELTKMENDNPQNIINYCFELKNVDNNFFSDYKLIKGTTKVMNALYLLKQYKIID